jgi:hypothetical protein
MQGTATATGDRRLRRDFVDSMLQGGALDPDLWITCGRGGALGPDFVDRMWQGAPWPRILWIACARAAPFAADFVESMLQGGADGGTCSTSPLRPMPDADIEVSVRRAARIQALCLSSMAFPYSALIVPATTSVRSIGARRTTPVSSARINRLRPSRNNASAAISGASLHEVNNSTRAGPSNSAEQPGKGRQKLHLASCTDFRDRLSDRVAVSN